MSGYFYGVTQLKNDGLPDLSRVKMGHTGNKVPEKYIYDKGLGLLLGQYIVCNRYNCVRRFIFI